MFEASWAIQGIPGTEGSQEINMTNHVHLCNDFCSFWGPPGSFALLFAPALDTDGSAADGLPNRGFFGNWRFRQASGLPNGVSLACTCRSARFAGTAVRGQPPAAGMAVQMDAQPHRGQSKNRQDYTVG